MDAAAKDFGVGVVEHDVTEILIGICVMQYREDHLFDVILGYYVPINVTVNEILRCGCRLSEPLFNVFHSILLRMCNHRNLY